MQNFKNSKGFTLVELLVVVSIISILSVGSYIGYGSYLSGAKNNQVSNDLLAISNALEQYSKDHFNTYPIPEPGENMNVLCFDADATYIHDCNLSAFRQGMIDNSLLTKRYLQEVPIDPRTGSRYVYGVSADGKYYEVAGIIDGENGWETELVSTSGREYYLASLIRSFDGSDFVIDGGSKLPYSPDYMTLSVTLENTSGTSVNSSTASNGTVAYSGDTITTNTSGSVDLYFSDGSVSYLGASSSLEIMSDSKVSENDKDGIATKIYLKLTSGKIWNKVTRLASRSEFNIETTSAIAGVRGTEFGVEITSAGEEKIILRSGSIEVKSSDSGSGSSITMENEYDPATSRGKTLTITSGIISNTAQNITNQEHQAIENDYYKTNTLHSGMIPYIVAVSPDTTNNKHDVYVSFNGITTEEIEFDGFEIYTNSQTEGKRDLIDEESPATTIVKDKIDYISSTDPDHPNTYHFVINYNNSGIFPINSASGKPDSIFLRAYKKNGGDNKTYSAFSWEPIAFSLTEERNYTNPEQFPGLAMQAYIAGVTMVDPETPVVLKAMLVNEKKDHSSTMYFWILKNTPDGSSTELTSPNEESISFIPDKEGLYAITLRARNDGELAIANFVVKAGEANLVTAISSIDINMLNTNNCNDEPVLAGGKICPNATISVNNPVSGMTMNCEWEIIDPNNIPLTRNPSPCDGNPQDTQFYYNTTITNAELGDYTMKLTATNTALGLSSSNEVIISVLEANMCGNGVLETPNSEQCDDGNAFAYDSCDNACNNTGITLYSDFTDSNNDSADYAEGNGLTIAMEGVAPDDVVVPVGNYITAQGLKFSNPANGQYY